MERQLKRNDGTLYAALLYEAEYELIYLDWSGFLTLDMVKTGSEDLLAMIQETHCEKVLVDNRKVSGPWQAANSWYQADWNPRAVEAGLRSMAVIMSENLFTQLSLQGFTIITRGVYTVNIFNSEITARQWLEGKTTEKMESY